MSVIGSNILAGASGQQGYNISRSVRLRSSASAYFNRTPASAGSQTTWTWSGWVKRGLLGGTYNLMEAETSSNTYTVMQFSSDNIIFDVRNGGAVVGNKYTTAVYRDPSAWYHIVFVWDTTNATASDRIRIYVNGVRVTAFGTSNDPSSSATSYGLNGAVSQRLGSGVTYPNYFDGYLTEINFIDGQALTPSSFGSTNAVTGVWQPAKYTGTYGTNGFYLNFSDNSNNTATTIGKDYSGNGNNWTPNNISVTSGSTYDSMLDTPTPYADGGNGRGNYCVLNPLEVILTPLTFSDGNLTATQPSTGTSRGAASTFKMSTGKWYFEAVTTVTSGTQGGIGIAESSNASTSYGIYKRGGSTVGLSGSPTFATYTNGDNIGVAFDADARTVSFYKNGTLQGTGGHTYTGTDPVGVRVTVDSSDSTGAWQLNFGQRPFASTPPTGFNALNTQNLPDSTITKGNKYFDATIWTGDNTTPKSIANSGSFQPDFVWLKSRSNAYQNNLYDSVRGAGAAYSLSSDQPAAEGGNSSTYGYLSAFNSTGFQVTQGSAGSGSAPNGNAYTNQTGTTYVGWQWKAGGTAVSNTDGSITSSVSANASAGFSIVQFTATGSNATVGHGLGVAPAMVIVKDAASVGNWAVYHKSLPSAAYYLYMNTTAAQGNVANIWNSTAPTSTVFSVGTWHTADRQIAYCFSEVAGFSKFGSYTGNGSTDGPFVYCGFLPRWVLIKRTDSTSSWLIVDTVRQTYNVLGPYLVPNASDAETTGTTVLDVLSNGFKSRSSTTLNASGGTYIFAAFAENPFKNSLAR